MASSVRFLPSKLGFARSGRLDIGKCSGFTRFSGLFITRASTSRNVFENGSNDEYNHYQVLGLNQSATSQDVKIAFRQLVHKYHPDVNKRDGADDIFKKVRHAYEVLSNAASRREYDRSLRELSLRREYDQFAEPFEKEKYYYPKQGGKVYSRMEHSKSTFQNTEQAYRNKQVPKDDVYEKENVKLPNSRSFRSKFNRNRQRAAYNNGDVYQRHDNYYANYFEDNVGSDLLCLQNCVTEALFGLWILALARHIHIVQNALTLFVVFMVSRRQLCVGYKVAFVLSWLVGGGGGLSLAFMLLFTSWTLGSAYGVPAAVYMSGIWLNCRHCFPLPSIVVMIMAYQCIQQQPSVQ